jgi:hypothetical protein
MRIVIPGARSTYPALSSEYNNASISLAGSGVTAARIRWIENTSSRPEKHPEYWEDANLCRNTFQSSYTSLCSRAHALAVSERNCQLPGLPLLGKRPKNVDAIEQCSPVILLRGPSFKETGTI